MAGVKRLFHPLVTRGHRRNLDPWNGGRGTAGGDTIMNLSNAFLRVGVLFGLAGISLGYYMGASQEFTAAPVHAHVNLLGWVAMFLYGLFYRAQPSAAMGLVPKIHFWTNVAGVLVMTTA